MLYSSELNNVDQQALIESESKEKTVRLFAIRCNLPTADDTRLEEIHDFIVMKK